MEKLQKNLIKNVEKDETKKKLKAAKGVTLIALVVTIVILIILAAVSINMLLGENGIIAMANKAKKDTELEEAKAKIELETLANQMAEYTNVDGGNTGEYQDPSGANAPVLKTGMEAVKWDETTGTWVTPTSNSDWYSYIDQQANTTDGTTGNIGSSKWANAKVTVNGVESYFVWVPRYEYKIDSANKKIDVKFIQTSTTTADTAGYTIHPAFRNEYSNDGNDQNDFLNGGWDDELPGIWVAKYEMSMEVNGTATTTSNSTIGNVLTSETIKAVSKPNVSSWRYITIGNMYTNALNYNTALNSHMMKNSEWGAVAYLTHSQYGRNGTEVTINNNSSYLTGNAGETVSASSSSTTNAYNTAKGQLASSTGNIYGIYDLSGGAYEYVAAWDTLSTSTSVSSYGSSFASKNGPSTRYATAYSNGTSSYEPTQAMAKIGDATYEVYAGSYRAWNSDGSYFVNSDSPFFRRGGSYSNTSGAGVFCAYSSSGDSLGFDSFRVCLAVK